MYRDAALVADENSGEGGRRIFVFISTLFCEVSVTEVAVRI